MNPTEKSMTGKPLHPAIVAQQLRKELKELDDVKPDFVINSGASQGNQTSPPQDGPVITSPDDGGVLFPDGQYFGLKTPVAEELPDSTKLEAVLKEKSPLYWRTRSYDLVDWNKRFKESIARWQATYSDKRLTDDPNFQALVKRYRDLGNIDSPPIKVGFDSELLPVVSPLFDKFSERLEPQADAPIILETGSDGKLHQDKPIPSDDDYTRSA